MNRDGSNKWEDPRAKSKTPASADLNIVCYNIGDNSSPMAIKENGQEPTLQQMVRFHQDEYDICVTKSGVRREKVGKYVAVANLGLSKLVAQF